MNKLKEEKLPEKRGLTVDEIISKYPMTVRILLVQLVEQIERLRKNTLSEDWLPTPENINALPEPVRKYIYDIETNCDPAGMVQENALLKDTCKALEIKLGEKSRIDIEEKGRELFGWSADPRTIKECVDFIRSILEEK